MMELNQNIQYKYYKVQTVLVLEIMAYVPICEVG